MITSKNSKGQADHAEFLSDEIAGNDVASDTIVSNSRLTGGPAAFLSIHFGKAGPRSTYSLGHLDKLEMEALFSI